MITLAEEKDHLSIINVWEVAVKATHHFISESYLDEIREMLPGILPNLQLYIYREEGSVIKGFAGVTEDKIEMLFIHPSCMGAGIGRLLVEFCIQVLKVNKVDVNEQNERAVGFYQKLGFRSVAREELDSLGRPYPILQMQYLIN